MRNGVVLGFAFTHNDKLLLTPRAQVCFARRGCLDVRETRVPASFANSVRPQGTVACLATAEVQQGRAVLFFRSTQSKKRQGSGAFFLAPEPLL